MAPPASIDPTELKLVYKSRFLSGTTPGEEYFSDCWTVTDNGGFPLATVYDRRFYDLIQGLIAASVPVA